MKYHDGADFDSADVKAQIERNAGPESANKQKKLFRALKAVEAPDPHTVVIRLDGPRSLLPFELAQAAAVVLDEGSFADGEHKPDWHRTLPLREVDQGRLGRDGEIRRPSQRGERANPKCEVQVHQRLHRPRVAALLAGDLDYMPALSANEMFPQFQADDRFTTLQGTTEGETIIATNNQHPALSDVRVRRAIMHAHRPPGADRRRDVRLWNANRAATSRPITRPTSISPGAIPTTPRRRRRCSPRRATATGLELTLHLPPPSYARRGGEIVAAMLADVGVTAKIENVEWAQWLENVYKKRQYAITIISHVEPMDIGRIYSDPGYYMQYDSAAFREDPRSVRGRDDERGAVPRARGRAAAWWPRMR